ncbi:MAG TPA: hypothetical protein VE085_08215 [Burkholderiales bacterium]|nr:hypothetical protein [Burkholderiales bacterium]
MPKKLADIFDKNGKLLHTYPIVVEGQNYTPTSKEFIELALRSAKDDKLVPEAELKSLKAVIRNK